MRIGIIGGTEKNLVRYEALAAQSGCEVEFHDGRMAGRGGEALEAVIKRCEIVVVITHINSHAAMHTVHKLARRHACRVLHVRRFGLHPFANLVQECRLAHAG